MPVTDILILGKDMEKNVRSLEWGCQESYFQHTEFDIHMKMSGSSWLLESGIQKEGRVEMSIWEP